MSKDIEKTRIKKTTFLNQKQNEIFSPKGYMRTNRPELFSDSILKTEKILNESILELHLNNLTSKKKEIAFEHFCRKIAEKEICPNLIPQTGPTGGGDSKVDSETYPVDDEISLRWYTSKNECSSKEQWAFAFSAKKDWKGKIRSDIKSILTKDRNYKKIYFFSNQFVSDKNRAECEDKLSKEFNIDIRIMSKEWLVEKVLENNHTDIAIRTLNINGFEESTKEIGPKDLSRKKELEKLETNIVDVNRYKGVEYQLVEDCLQSALLSRGLEDSRDIIDGKFLRAKRIAKKYRLKFQEFEVNYHHAKTSFWWFEDYLATDQMYNEVEEYCLSSSESSVLQKIVTLFVLLSTAFKEEKIDIEKEILIKRKEALIKRINQLGSEESRPSNALWAKQLGLDLKLLDLLDLNEISDLKKAVRSVINGYSDILDKSRSLLDFPVDSTIKLITKLGDFIEECPEYDQLFEKVTKITSNRKGDIESGKLLASRACKCLKKDNLLLAVKYFGKALIKFSKEETVEMLTRSLFGVGTSYERMGLFWAAKSNYMHVIYRSLKEYWTKKTLSPFLIKFLNLMFWLEIKLGRPIQAIYWRELADVIQSSQILSAEKVGELVSERSMQDAVLGILLLKSNFNDLDNVTQLPYVLDTLDLQTSHLTSLFVLGNFAEIEKLKFFPEEEKIENLNDFFLKMLKQPANKDLPEHPVFGFKGSGHCSGVFMGCKIHVHYFKIEHEIIAEMIISVFESIWATLIEHKAFPHKSSFNIYIEKEFSKELDEPFEYSTSVKEGETVLNIKLGQKPINEYKSMDDRLKIKNSLFKITTLILPHIASVKNIRSVIDKIFRDEDAHNRALIFSELHIISSNIFGDGHVFDFKKFLKPHKNKPIYQVLRKVSWNKTDESSQQQSSVGSKPLSPGKGTIPKELFRPIKNHNEVSVMSIIDRNLWDKAQWSATAYIYIPKSPSFVLFCYKDISYGREIFKGLIKKVGRVDQKKILRLSIVRGIDRTQPHSYLVILGVDPNSYEKKSESKLFVLSPKINRMDAITPTNLENFLSHYEYSSKCIIAPASSSGFHPQYINEYGIEIKNLVVKYAWEIGENDMDIVALQDNSNPYIPDSEKNPPILRAMKKIKNIKNSEQFK